MTEFPRPLQPIRTEGDLTSRFRPDRTHLGSAEPMTQQSPTRSFLVGATFRGAAKAPRSGSALARLALAGLFGGGLLAPFASAQYPQSAPPANYGVPQSYAAPQNTGTNVSADPQLAGQTDEQLAAEARLFMQQGRTAPAQRIYLELQRRSIIRSSAL